MHGAVDSDQTPAAIYREWLGSLPAVTYVTDAEGGGRYVLRAWLDEINNGTPAATRPWLDEVGNPTTTRPWLDEINSPRVTSVRPWLDEVGNPTAVRPWLDEVGNPTAVRPWLDEVTNPRVRTWLDEVNNPQVRNWLDEIPTQPAGVTHRGGSNEVDLAAPQGRVRVWLPDDMAAGDTITGTVVAEPSGRDESQRRASSDTLEGYVLDVGGARTPISAGRFTFVAPAAPLALGLMDNNRRVAGATLNAAPPVGPGPRQVVIPNLGQAGRPLEIPGNFDGAAENTRVQIGGQPAEVIAESPRQAVIWTPPEPAANTNISVTENGRTTQAPYRNIRIQLSSPKTSLQRGEQTVVHVQVTGLEGLTEPVNLRLEASSSVQMAGGNAQVIPIAPSAVGPGGAFQTDRQLQATQSGPFTVTGTLMTSGGPP